jgi:hypothetical protein
VSGSLNPAGNDKEKEKANNSFFFVLIQRSKNQDYTELAKNPKLTLKSFNSTPSAK